MRRTYKNTEQMISKASILIAEQVRNTNNLNFSRTFLPKQSMYMLT